MDEPKVKTKVNWLQVASIVLPLLIGMVIGWFSMRERVTRLEDAVATVKSNDVTKEFDKINSRFDKFEEKWDGKQAKMWETISKKRDK